MRAILLALVLAVAALPLGNVAADAPCGPNVQRCEPFDPCRYNPHDPVRSPFQYVLCGDAEAAVERILGGLAP